VSLIPVVHLDSRISVPLSFLSKKSASGHTRYFVKNKHIEEYGGTSRVVRFSKLVL
jgi:hypothetical protein